MWLNCFCFQFLLLSPTFSSISIEELGKLAEFPPILKENPGEPLGHNKPLGWQRPPEGPVIEYTQALNANEYWNKHVKDHIPLVYRGYIKDSPAISKWNDKYLSQKYGDIDVLVEHKIEDRSSTSGRMRLGDFLKHYREDDLYVVSMFPSEMMGEVRAIPSVLCGTFKDFTHESNLWISSGGTRSVVHYDADHNLHCLLDGRKDFIMINNNITTQTNLYFKRKDPDVGSGFSFLDPDSIDMKKFKNIEKVPWTYATLYPGDCIYIPSVYIHQVRGYGRTIAVTTLFTADVQNNFNGDGCTDDIMEKYHSMAEIDFQWTYKKGDKTIDMGYMNVQIVKKSIKEGLKDTDFTSNGKFSRKQFVVFAGLFGPYARNRTLINHIWRNVFNYADDYMFDENSISSLSHEQWKMFCRAIEEPHGVVTNGSEPIFVRPGERHKWEQEHPNEVDDEQYFTEDEMEIKLQAERDPMFDYLSKEEKAEYIQKKKEDKARFGVQYEPDDRSVDGIASIHWRMMDVPAEYRKSLEKGVIPKLYKDELMSVLPNSVIETYADYFAENRLPQELIDHLNDIDRTSYMEQVRQYLHENDDEEEKEEEAVSNNFPFEFQDIDDVELRKDLLDGKIPKKHQKQMLMYMPNRLKVYKDDIKRGVVPRQVLMVLLRTDENSLEEKVKQLKSELHLLKVEL